MLNFYWSESEKQVFSPPEQITVSEWSDKHRVLLPQASAEPGQWRTSRTPYLQFLQDSFSNTEVEEIVFCKSTQIGGTEAIYNCLGYAITQEPAPALMVLPTVDLAEYASRNRIQPMIDVSDVLKERKSPIDDEFTKLEMVFTGMVLCLAGANSAASLASRPCRYLFLDEVDKYPKFAGKEADPISLAYERTKTFWNRKIFLASTPTVEDGNIWVRLNKCQVIYQFYVPCPNCGHYQVLDFQNVKWPQDLREPEKVRGKCWYECESCKTIISEKQKTRMIINGQWKPKDDQKLDKNVIYRTIGFWINSLYSPWLSFGDVAAEFLKSKDVPELLQNFRNSWLAEPWIERIYKKKVNDILYHVSSMPMMIVPNDTIALTAGVDPSKGGFYFLILAWESTKTIHVVHHGFVTTWEAIKTILLDKRYDNESRTLKYPVWRSGIDTGGSKYDGEETTMTESAYNFIRNYSIMNRIYGTKGQSTKTAHRMTFSIIDKMPSKNGIKIEGGLSLWLINTDQFKDAIHYKLQVNPSDNGGITFHNETYKDFAQHLIAEEKRRDRKGQWNWIQVNNLNHYLDCLIIAMAMGDGACWGGVGVLQKPEAFNFQREEKKRKIIVEKEEKKNDWFGDYGKNLFR